MHAQSDKTSVSDVDAGSSEQRVVTWMRAVATERNPVALGHIYRLFAPRVKGCVVRQGADSALADDLAQETMVQVWRKACQYDPVKAAPAAWNFRMARNLQTDRLRRQRFCEARLTPDTECAVPDAIDSDRFLG